MAICKAACPAAGVRLTQAHHRVADPGGWLLLGKFELNLEGV